MDRLIYRQLLDWKDKAGRRPLLLQGVRQCGKTFILKEFGRKEFKNCVYCNFEDTPLLGNYFINDLHPERIVSDLEKYFNVKITPGETLLIFDEIQECEKAITSLKYFCEDMPDLHVACAGSLLGVSRSKASFPVGKIDRMDMYPMNFHEFIVASGKSMLADSLSSEESLFGISEFLHESIMSLLADYCIVGGMPKAVLSWVNEHDLGKVTTIQKEILRDYEDDFSKHGRDMVEKITAVWNSVPAQLSKENRRFMFNKLKNQGRSDEFEASIQWLVDAHLIYRVDQIEGNLFPPSITENSSLFKIYLCDIGLLRAMSGHPPRFIVVDDDEYRLYKGGMTENLVACELSSYNAGSLYYWRDGVYEVDLIIAGDGYNIPVEIKYGTNYDLKSLKVFLKKEDVDRAFVVSRRMPKKGGITYVPLYGVRHMLKSDAAEGYSRPDDDFPFTTLISAGDWTSSGKQFVYSVKQEVHMKGDHPLAKIKSKSAGIKMTIDDSGNITLTSKERCDCRLIII